MADLAIPEPPPVVETPWLRRLPSASRFSLRGDAAVQAAAGAAFGVALPASACQSATSATRAALWLGPDEQLLLAPLADGAGLKATLERALAGTAHSLVDISYRQVGLEIRGPHAAWRLNAGCPLDLDRSAFPVGMCTRTVFLKAEVVLWRTAADAFHLEVWRSFTDYLVGLLKEVDLELAG